MGIFREHTEDRHRDAAAELFHLCECLNRGTARHTVALRGVYADVCDRGNAVLRSHNTEPAQAFLNSMQVTQGSASPPRCPVVTPMRDPHSW